MLFALSGLALLSLLATRSSAQEPAALETPLAHANAVALFDLTVR